jgi:hypothetical protein
VKNFLWLVLKKKNIRTKDVLLKRGGKCTKNCLFCGKEESINHLFFACPLARYIWNIVSCATALKCQFDNVENCFNVWLKGFGGKKRKMLSLGVTAVLWGIWKTRNLACFEHKWPSKPIEVLHKICYRINWWANLQAMEEKKLELQVGAKVLERIAGEIFQASQGWATWRPRLRG